MALKNLGERKLRTFLTSLAIVLGVMMVAGTYVLTDTINKSFDQIFTETNEGTDAVVSYKEIVETDDGTAPPISAQLLARIQKAPGVASAAGGITDPQVSIIGSDGERLGGGGPPTFGFSVLPEPFDPLSIEGRKPRTADEVVIDKFSAENEGFEIGDEVRVAGRTSAGTYTLVGTAGLGSADTFGGATAAVFTLPEAQRITGKEGQFDQIAVAADEGTTPGQLAATLDSLLPKTVQVETGTENTESQKDDVGEFTDILKTALLVFAGVALFVASFLIFNTFSITVAQRTREFAMLRTLGANRRQIVTAVMTEAFAIGLGAAVLGLLAGIAFSYAIQSLFESLGVDLPTTDTVVASRTIIVSLIIGTVITVVAALIPALRATRISPVTGLREGAVLETKRQGQVRTVIALVLTVLGIGLMVAGLFGALSPGEVAVGFGAGVTFIGVALISPRLVGPLASLVGRPLERLRGVPGRLARENAVRHPGRTAATAAALMIGLALVSFVTVFAAGLKGSIDDAIDKTLDSDLIIGNTDGFSDIPLETGNAAAEIDGIALASPLRYTQARVKGAGSGYVTLVQPQSAPEMLKLDWTDGDDDVVRRLGPTDAALDEKWADKENFEIGDTFEATTATGKRITYTVRGLFTDNADFSGNFVASDVNARAYGEEGNATNVLLRLEPGADAGQVREDIDAMLKERFPTAEAQSNEELKDKIADQLDQLLNVVYALLGLAVIVSLFGIVNTLALSIYERTRELGLLRAVGMSRRQVRRIVRYESVITALIGAVLGSVLGVVFAVVVSRPLADEGFTLSIPFGTLIVLLILAVIAGVVAAIGPARRASRLKVLEALAYE